MNSASRSLWKEKVKIRDRLTWGWQNSTMCYRHMGITGEIQHNVHKHLKSWRGSWCNITPVTIWNWLDLRLSFGITFTTDLMEAKSLTFSPAYRAQNNKHEPFLAINTGGLCTYSMSWKIFKPYAHMSAQTHGFQMAGLSLSVTSQIRSHLHLKDKFGTIRTTPNQLI